MKRFGVILLLVLRAIAFADPTEEDFLTNAASFLKSSPKQSIELEKADIWVFIHLKPKEITESGCQMTMALIDSAIAQKNARGYFARAVISEHCRGEFPTPESDMNEAAKHSAVYSEVRKGISQSVEEGKQKRTIADMRAIAMAVESYAVDFNEFPEETTGTAASLVNKLQGTYIKQLPLIDPWGNAYRYYCVNSQ